MPPVLYRPSDNAEFIRYKNGLYGQEESSYGYLSDHLISLGFRDYPFTQEEMEWSHPYTINCKINGVPSEIVISQKELEKIKELL